MNLFELIFILYSKPEKALGKIAKEYKLTVSSAESCTGGLVSSLLTDVSGSSEYITENIVTYSNNAKNKYLNVKTDTLEKYGAVSEQTAVEMAQGLINQTGSNYAVTTTGIAGPTGGTENKPVGLMYIGLANKQYVQSIKVVVPKYLPRVIMKKVFAKKALIELYKFIKKDF